MTTILSAILQATVVSILAGTAFWLVLRRFRGVSPNTHRLIWFGVLLLGVCIVRRPVDVPFYDSEPPITTAQVTLPDESRQLFDVSYELQRPRASQGDAANGDTANVIAQIPIAVQPATISQQPVTTFHLIDKLPLAIIILWFAGVIVLLVRRCVLFVQLEMRLRGLQCTGASQGDAANDDTTNNDAAHQWKNLLSQFGIAWEKVPVLWTDNTGPALVRSLSGWRLLFPCSLWDDLSPEHREGVLRHELSHYRSGDAWTSEFARLLATLQWFNPVAWIALGKLEEATEWRCDDFAVATGATRVTGRSTDSAAGAIDGLPSERGLQVLIETLLAIHDSTESLGLYLGATSATNSSFAKINVITRIQRLHNTHSRKENTIMKTMKKTLLLTLFLAFLTAATLQVRLTAKTLETRPEPQAPALANVATETEVQQPDSFALALAMPETNDRERDAKFGSLVYLLPWPDDSGNLDSQQIASVEEECFRVANAMELPTLRTEKLLACAWHYANKEQWDKYTTLADQLDPLFKEMAHAYRQSYDDVKADRRDAAKERLLAFKPRILAMRHSYGSAVATVFCFTALAKLGFVDEVVEQCKQVRASWSLPDIASRFDPQSKEDDYWEQYVIDHSFRNAIMEVGIDFARHDQPETALDFACKMYEAGKPFSAVTDSTKSIMDFVVEKYAKNGDLDNAMQAFERIVGVVGKYAQWTSRPIFLALLENNDPDRALDLTRKIDSFNENVQNQMYFELMEYMLIHDDREKCAEMLDEVMERAAKLERPANRLKNMENIVKIAVQLNNPSKVDQVLIAAEKSRDAALTEKDPQAYDDIVAERNQVHVLHDFAAVQFAADRIDDAKKTLADALRQADKVVDAERSAESLRQKDWAICGVARKQTDLGLADDAFYTVALMVDQEAKTEGYYYICGGFISAKDFPNARKALTLAKECLKEINNSRIFGNVEYLERQLEKAEKGQ